VTPTLAYPHKRRPVLGSAQIRLSAGSDLADQRPNYKTG